MNELKGVFSHVSDDWRTPKKLYEAFMNKNYIDCFKYQTTENEFLRDYESKKLFVNPPYSKMKMVSKWIFEQVRRKNLVYLLIPARTDTQYFHELLKLNPTIFFIQGRLKFNDGKQTAPFPSIILKFCATYYGVLWTQYPYYISVTLDQFIEKEIL